jgi:hypothetical protein
MNNNDSNISVAQAKSTLESLASIQEHSNEAIRPPLWLTVIIACSYGMMTFSWAATRHENLWVLGLIISTGAFLLALAFYLYCSRLIGVKPKLVPRNASEFKFQIVSAIFFGIVFALTRVASTHGFWWASFVGGAINALALAFLLHNYSTGDFKMSAKQHD